MRKRFGTLFLLALVLSLVFALSSCFGSNNDDDGECEHGYELVGKTDADCVTQGRLEYQCGKCGETMEEIIPATGEHIPSGFRMEGSVLPTCTEKGIEIQLCEICGEELSIEVDALGHSADVYDGVEPTCTEGGYREYTCIDCGEFISEELEALGHEETAYEEVAPDCINVGYTGGTYCSACEVTLSERTELPATGEHTSVAYEEVVPTCGTVGYTGGTYCSVCEAELSARTELPVQGEHTEVAYEDVVPTCGTVGYTGGTYCSVCEVTLSERTEIPATGEHTEVDVPEVSATCTSTGLSAGKQCTVCQVFTVPQKEIAMTAHKYSYTIVTNPEYEVAGLGKYTCSVCEDSYEEEIPALTYQPSEVWTGDVAESFASGEGTAENPYIIETPAQLAYFALQVNSGVHYSGQYISLGNDIILNDTVGYKSWSTSNAPANNWTPIGYSGGLAFAGYFDGCGYSVKGLYCNIKESSYSTLYAGLFGQATKGSVKNLNVTEAYIYSGDSYGGGIVGNVDVSDNSIIISGCSFNGTIIGNSSTGGIIGAVRCGWSNADRVNGSIQMVHHYGYVTISDCTVNGKVASNNMTLPENDVYVGGIAGYVYYGCGTILIGNCENNAKITSKYHAGGVFGGITRSSGNGDYISLSLTNCKNTGNVTANGNAGGIASKLYVSGKSSAYDKFTLYYCSNTGKISSNGTGSNASIGGIFGDLSVSGVPSCDVYSLYSTGNISVKGSAYRVGGIAGGISLSSTATPTFKNSFNSGSITVETASYVGGLCGITFSSMTVDSCYNEGDIISNNQNVGGLFGYADGSGSYANLYNLGDVTGGDKNVGGIFGYASRVTLKTSFNAGKVSGTGVYVGAITGYMASSASTPCYFLEGCATDGQGYVQGIFGLNENKTGNSYNKSLSQDSMYKSSTYTDFDFKSVWNAPSSEDGTYPTLVKVVKVPKVTE